MTAAPGPAPGLDITSPANPRVRRAVALRRRRAREDAGLTLVEGYAELSLALAAGAAPVTLFTCPDLTGPADPRGVTGLARAAGADVVTVSRAVFGKLAYRESPDGWLAEVPAVPTGLSRIAPGVNPLVMICEGVEKPGNLGAILRTADAAGAAAVIAADPATDWGNPNVVRASKGTLFCVPVAAATSAQALAWVADAGLALVVATPDGDTPLASASLAGPMALAVGSEARGLSPEWLKRASARVRIPMFGRADSLNVATAAAIVAYEAVRQRMACGAPGTIG